MEKGLQKVTSKLDYRIGECGWVHILSIDSRYPDEDIVIGQKASQVGGESRQQGALCNQFRFLHVIRQTTGK